MAKVKTFANTLKAFHAKQEIQALVASVPGIQGVVIGIFGPGIAVVEIKFQFPVMRYFCG